MKSTAFFATTLLALTGGLLATGNAIAENDRSTAERVATFDFGSLDTLDELGLDDRVVALPKQSLPEYLEQYQSDDYIDLGGLRSPDFDALRDADPSLILYTGRQNEWQEQFEEIAEAINAGLGGDDGYMAGFDANVTRLAERFAAGEQAEQALHSLHARIDETRQALDDAPQVLVATHNEGNLTLNTHPVVHEVLGLSEPQIPESVPSETRGTRTFTPLSAETIAEIGPDVVLVIDRSAAIGGDVTLDRDALSEALEQAGAEDVRIEVLTPELWYLSGGGLQSLSRQIEEVATALER
ncbi:MULTISPECIES: ABC transporter substrate-binding protein [Halomonadaceae]|uniref:ABC transporter substrate-binding protein n=1 Tax=Halomonadaceae TaxID=28256 RepID=UPI00159B5D0D|nr:MULTISPECIES: ABC transporter substrate-binding protein [Halomonas]QJQ96192.1 ABC transporter substrate-binding protein [Halomonas sp. PA5]